METSPPPPLSQTTDRIALRTLAQRRRRVIRGILLFLVVSFAVVVMSAMNRDQQALDSCRERIEYAAREFQKVHDARRSPPSELPLPSAAPRAHYLYNWLFTNSSQPEAGVACCDGPHARFWGEPIRMVIILDTRAGQYRAVRMTEDEFRRRARELGLEGGL
jgi:hypothetical protein